MPRSAYADPKQNAVSDEPTVRDDGPDAIDSSATGSGTTGSTPETGVGSEPPNAGSRVESDAGPGAG